MTDRKLGRGKRKPSTAKWKTRFNLGLGLKHRLAKRRARRAKLWAEGRISRLENK